MVMDLVLSEPKCEEIQACARFVFCFLPFLSPPPAAVLPRGQRSPALLGTVPVLDLLLLFLLSVTYAAASAAEVHKPEREGCMGRIIN